MNNILQFYDFICSCSVNLKLSYFYVMLPAQQTLAGKFSMFGLDCFLMLVFQTKYADG